ncbi:MAG: hypothetical protein Tsb005_21170 [Gammaproteobacteria bacterium]
MTYFTAKIKNKEERLNVDLDEPLNKITGKSIRRSVYGVSLKNYVQEGEQLVAALKALKDLGSTDNDFDEIFILIADGKLGALTLQGFYPDTSFETLVRMANEESLAWEERNKEFLKRALGPKYKNYIIKYAAVEKLPQFQEWYNLFIQLKKNPEKNKISKHEITTQRYPQIQLTKKIKESLTENVDIYCKRKQKKIREYNFKNQEKVKLNEELLRSNSEEYLLTEAAAIIALLIEKDARFFAYPNHTIPLLAAIEEDIHIPGNTPGKQRPVIRNLELEVITHAPKNIDITDPNHSRSNGKSPHPEASNNNSKHAAYVLNQTINFNYGNINSKLMTENNHSNQSDSVHRCNLHNETPNQNSAKSTIPLLEKEDTDSVNAATANQKLSSSTHGFFPTKNRESSYSIATAAESIPRSPVEEYLRAVAMLRQSKQISQDMLQTFVDCALKSLANGNLNNENLKEEAFSTVRQIERNSINYFEKTYDDEHRSPSPTPYN